MNPGSSETFTLGYISKAGLDVTELMDEFKAVYRRNGRYDLKSQVPYLSRLAEIYMKRSEASSLKWVELLKVRSLMNHLGWLIVYFYDFQINSDSFFTELTPILIQAHALYNSCYARDGDQCWQREAFAVQQLYWDATIQLSYSEQMHVTERLKVALGRVRDRVKSDLREVESLVKLFNFDPEDIRTEQNNQLTDKWISKVKCLSSTCNKDMIHFTSTVIKEAMKICG